MTVEELCGLIDQIAQAEETYYNLDYQYRQVIDQISRIESDLLTSGDVSGKTVKEKEAELFQHTHELQTQKRNLQYQANIAKAKLNRLERLYQVQMFKQKSRPQ